MGVGKGLYNIRTSEGAKSADLKTGEEMIGWSSKRGGGRKGTCESTNWREEWGGKSKRSEGRC